MSGILTDASQSIGNTPLVLLRNITKGLPARIEVKMEYMNPTGSVKDRAAAFMIDEAERQELITPGKTVLVEATSGNMGISLAFYARIRGYKIILCMSAAMSIERRAMLRAFGAEVILIDPSLGGLAMCERAKTIADSHPDFYWLNQFGNPANAESHYRTTGPEIWRQTDGTVDMVCFGVGSGGTLTGVGRYLKEQKPEIGIYAVEPYESSILNGQKPHSHKIQGMSAGFIPEVLDRSVFREALRVHSDDAIAMAKRLATEEAILGGISSEANVCAAVQLAKRPENEGKLIVTSVNSFAERYLSTALYVDVKEEAEKLEVKSVEESLAVAKRLLSDGADR